MVRSHVAINEHCLSKTLRRLGVRPYVVLQLFYFLIDQGRATFRGRGRVWELKQRMREAMQRHQQIITTPPRGAGMAAARRFLRGDVRKSEKGSR